jgi:hypothetical protein
MSQVFLQSGVQSSLALSNDIIEVAAPPSGLYLARLELVTDAPVILGTLMSHSPSSPPIVAEWHATPSHSEYLKEFLWGTGEEGTLRLQSFSALPTCTMFYRFTLFSLP